MLNSLCYQDFAFVWPRQRIGARLDYTIATLRFCWLHMQATHLVCFHFVRSLFGLSVSLSLYLSVSLSLCRSVALSLCLSASVCPPVSLFLSRYFLLSNTVRRLLLVSTVESHGLIALHPQLRGLVVLESIR